MKQITDEEFLEDFDAQTRKPELHDPVKIVLVATESCPNCHALIAQIDEKHPEWPVEKYIYSGSNDKINTIIDSFKIDQLPGILTICSTSRSAIVKDGGPADILFIEELLGCMAQDYQSMTKVDPPADEVL